MADASQEASPLSTARTTHSRATRVLYAWLHEEPTGIGARIVQGAIQALIAVNVVALVAETVPSIGASYATHFAVLERVSIAIFSVEYVLRIASCTVDARFRRPVLGRLRYALTPMAVIDLLAVAPAYLPWVAADLRELRAVRLMRVFRVLKLGRYSRAVRSLGSAILSRKEELAIVGFAMGILLLLASSLLYFAERDAQPVAFGSIPAAAWWGVATLTTVGYGDVAPVTVLGKLAASLVAFMGIGLFALPAGILGSAFVEQLRRQKRCPHCGKDL
jgi:voltage-gated potassium channel